MHIFTLSPVLAILAFAGIVAGAVVAVPEPKLPVPKAEPVSFVSTFGRVCSQEAAKPKYNYQSPCLARVVMEFTGSN